MHIRLVSSLTAADEDPVATRVIETLAELLAALPIAYSLRIETASGKVLQYSSPTIESELPQPFAPTPRRRENHRR